MQMDQTKDLSNLYDPRENIFLFYTKNDYFSQFYPAKFTVDGIEYNCCEQYMMHQKAVLFKDKEMGDKIMKESDPSVIKRFGRRVKNFNDEEWDKKCRDIVFRGNMAKFSQNENLKSKLLSTGTQHIAEASPHDRRWGIGLGTNNMDANNPEKWRGKNWLGIALMKVRTELRSVEQ